MATKKQILGIDVSKHNGQIDFAKVKKAGYSFVIIRCGYGQDISAQDDFMFEKNYQNAKKAGLKVGVYIYSYAKSKVMAQGEARHVLRLIKGKELDLPIYIDCEEKGTEPYAKNCAKAFCDYLEKKGYFCGVYANTYWHNKYLKGIEDKYTFWEANYGSNDGKINSDIKADIHQYTSRGCVDGIKGAVDINVLHRTTLFNDIAKFYGRKAGKAK